MLTHALRIGSRRCQTNGLHPSICTQSPLQLRPYDQTSTYVPQVAFPHSLERAGKLDYGARTKSIEFSSALLCNTPRSDSKGTD